jgi:hypothetical protein
MVVGWCVVLLQWRFVRANEAKVDGNVRAYFALKAVDRWLSVRYTHRRGKLTLGSKGPH